MATLLSKPLKRALNIGGADYVITIAPEGITIVPKGKRKGQTWTWGSLMSGETTLGSAHRAYVASGEPGSNGSE